MFAVHSKDLRKLTMNLIVLPAQALGDPDSSPFMLCKKTEHSRVIGAEVLLWNHLEELLGKNDMAVFIFIVRITVRVMNSNGWLSVFNIPLGPST